jgi:hypothetical protein
MHTLLQNLQGGAHTRPIPRGVYLRWSDYIIRGGNVLRDSIAMRKSAFARTHWGQICSDPNANFAF